MRNAENLKQVTDRLAADEADLAQSSFTNVNFFTSCFDDCNMTGLAISDANLSGSRIDNANLSGVAISNCRLLGATIDGVAIIDLFAAYRMQKRGET